MNFNKKNKKKKLKFNLLEFFENLSFKDRTKITQALRAHSEQKKISLKEGKYNEVIPNEVRGDIKKFSETHNKVFQKFKEKKDENDKFSNKYKIFYLDPEKTKNNEIFYDLLSNYRERNYIIPDININLFDPSPLLMDNNRIVDFAKVSNDIRSYDKSLIYLEKLNQFTQERLAVENRIMPTKDRIKVKRSISHDYNPINSNTEGNNIKHRKEECKDIKDTITLEKNPSLTLRKDSNFISNNEKPHIFNEFSRNINRKTSLIQYLDSKSTEQNPVETNKLRVLKSETKQSFSSIDALKKFKTNLSRNFPKNLITEKKPVSPILVRRNSLINPEFNIQFQKKSIQKDIEDKIKSHVNHDLESIYESSKNKDHDYQKTVDYLIKTTGKNRTVYIEGLKTKLDPNENIKTIFDTKNLVNNCNLNEIHRNFVSKLGSLEINKGFLNNIRYRFYKFRDIDANINKLEYQMIKKLNYNKK
jgi:hypothetical protein